MSFIETPVFPRNISAGARIRFIDSVEKVRLANGYEFTNINWSQSLREYTIAMPLNVVSDMVALRALHLSVRTAHGFRLQDWTDYQCIQADGFLGTTALGTTSLTYQLNKRYLTGTLTQFRQIRKPISTGIVVYRAGVPATPGTGVNQFVLDTTTGMVTWGAGSTLNGIALAWTGTFDTPCTFTTELSMTTVMRNTNMSEQFTLMEFRPT